MDTDQSATAIREIVTQAGEITGSKLALTLRSLAPDWNVAAFGMSSLREFVEQHVSGIVAAGRSGMDVVYKPQTGLPASKPHTKQLWTTWVSPFGRYALFVDPKNGQVDQLPRATTPPKDVQRLVSPSEADHLALAKAFLDAQPQLKPHLADILETPKRQWWRQWYTEVSKTGHRDDWKAFRQAQLEDRLRIELRSALKNDDRAAQAFSIVVQTNPASDRQTTTSKPQVGTSFTAKRAIIEAIEQMSDDQVRSLQEALEAISNALRQRSN